MPKSATKQRFLVLMCLLLLGLGMFLGVRYYVFPPARKMLALNTDFVPQPDPSFSAEAPVDPAIDTEVKLPDGATVHIPAGAFKTSATARVSRLLNAPPPYGCERQLGAVYDISVDGLQPEEPIDIELPFNATSVGADAPDEDYAIFRWKGDAWRPYPAAVDRSRNTVRARVMHLSTQQPGKTKRYQNGPAQLILNPTDDSKGPKLVPRGATVECIIFADPSLTGKYKTVRVWNDDTVQYGDGSGNFVTGYGRVIEEPYPFAHGLTLKFILRLSGHADLGERHVALMAGGLNPPMVYKDAFSVCHPLVAIIDIDGMRQDIFHGVLGSLASDDSALHRIVGNFVDRKEDGAFRLRNFQRGVSLDETCTIFPPVTAAGHAAIFSGSDLREFRMAGNHWFDRITLRKFGYMGYDALDVVRAPYWGEANARLLAAKGITTVYQDAWSQQDETHSVVFHNFYYGDGKNAARWENEGWVDMGLYVPCCTTIATDASMTYKAGQLMMRREGEYPKDAAARKLGIVTLYFSGLDHRGHIGTDPARLVQRQQVYLMNNLDPMLGLFTNSMSEVVYKNTTFVFTADHGQSDMEDNPVFGNVDDNVRCFAKTGECAFGPSIFSAVERRKSTHMLEQLLYEFGYLVAGKYQLADGQSEEIGFADRTGEFGLNGGMAQIYLRRTKEKDHVPEPFFQRPVTHDEFQRNRDSFADWSEPPQFSQVLAVAEMFSKWNRAGCQALHTDPPKMPHDLSGYRGSLDLILVRDGTGPYCVYLGDEYAGKRSQEFRAWLKTEDGRKFLQRYDWNPDDRDADFVADRVERLNGPMSGDIILLPKYPSYYFEFGPQHGDHGGITRFELEVPFAAFRPGATAEELEHIRSVMMRSVRIEPEGKNRPAVTDVKPFVLAILRDPVPVREASRPKPPLDIDSGEWEVRIKLDPYNEGTNGKAIAGDASYVSELTDAGATLVLEYKDREHRENPPKKTAIKITWSPPPKVIAPHKLYYFSVEVTLDTLENFVCENDLPEVKLPFYTNPFPNSSLELSESERSSQTCKIHRYEFGGLGNVYEVNHPNNIKYRFQLKGWTDIVNGTQVRTNYPNTFGVLVSSEKRAYALFEYNRKN